MSIKNNSKMNKSRQSRRSKAIAYQQVPKGVIEEQIKQENIKSDRKNDKKEGRHDKKSGRNSFEGLQQLIMKKVGLFQVDYIIEEQIGKGSFGTVWRVRHKALGIIRALKMIRKQSSNPLFSNFDQIAVLKKLDHPNILRIYEFYESEDYYYIVTEYFKGKELFELVEAEKLNEAFAVDIMRELLKTLNYTFNQRVIHRDIKPQNILVHTDEKGVHHVKVIDWGLGALVGKDKVNRICGTPQYCAPEVLSGKYDLSCDMWSLGVVLYIMLTGNMPFSQNTTKSTIEAVKKGNLNVAVPEFAALSTHAQQFILALINKNPAHRLTPQQALAHPWITVQTKTILIPPLLNATMDRLKNFRKVNQFATAVITFLNNHLCSVEEHIKIQEIFNYLDKNGDGTLSAAQLTAYYAKIYGKAVASKIVEDIFIKIDLNQNGLIEFSEFMTFAAQYTRQDEKKALFQAFKLFDKDKNGQISTEEISLILRGKISTVADSEIQSIVQSIDKDSNGLIDFNEFVHCIQQIYHCTQLNQKQKQTPASKRSNKQVIQNIKTTSKSNKYQKQIVSNNKKIKDQKQTVCNRSQNKKEESRNKNIKKQFIIHN